MVVHDETISFEADVGLLQFQARCGCQYEGEHS